MRPTAMSSVPVTAAGVRRASEASRSFGTMRTQSCADAIARSTSAIGMARLSLIVTAWLWQRIAPTRTQRPSIGTGADERPRILLPSAPALNSSRL